MCQCPRRAILISTEHLKWTSIGLQQSVNALGGLFSFLQAWKKYRRALLNWVSMPSAGYSHFYLMCYGGRLPWRLKGVNALGGLFSFLLKISKNVSKSEMTCVNALGGLFSFLHFFKYSSKGNGNYVSMPSAGYSHFYRDAVQEIPRRLVCQCPRRAILISTEKTLIIPTLTICVNALGGLFSFLPLPTSS